MKTIETFEQPGDVVTLVAPYDVTGGDGLLVGIIFGIAAYQVASGTPVETCTTGVFRINALSTDVGAQGAAVYWDNTNRRVTTSSSGNTAIGALVVAKQNGSAVAVVRVVSGDKNFPIVTSNDGTRDILRMVDGSWLQVGVAAQGAGKELVNFSRLDTNSGAVIRPSNVYVEQATNLGTTMTCDFHNIDALCYGGGSNTRYTANVGLYCIEGQAQFTGTASQTLGKAVGVYGLSKSGSTNGTLSISAGVQGSVQNTGAGTTTLGACFYAKTPTVSAGTLAAAYGFYAEDVTGGTVNYAIRTNAGRVNFFAGTAVPAGGTAGVGVTMSSTADLGVFFGSGVPTLSAAQGSLYMRTDGSSTSTRMYVNTNGTTGWTAVTTAT